MLMQSRTQAPERLLHLAHRAQLRLLRLPRHNEGVTRAHQLAVPLHAYFTYSLFWLITLGAKGLWGYYMIILPLVKPIAAIWKFEDQCWSGNPTTPTVYCPPRLQGTTEIPADVIVRKVVLSVLAAKTGYEVEMIEMDMALETELGVDSIKRVEILSEVQKELNVEAQDVAALSRTQTVGEVVEAMIKELGSSALSLIHI